MRSWRVRIHQALLDPEILVAEAHLALIGVALGVRTLSNPTALAAPAYRYMAGVAPEMAWGVVMVAVGGMQLLGIVARLQRVRMACMFLTAMYWTVVTILIAAANPIGWGPVIFGIMALTSFWAYLRLTARQART